MEYFRTTFPSQSVTPNLHMLEDHVVDFINKWKFGLGMYGEQGGESIHPEFTRFKKTYASVRPNAARVKVMLEHYYPDKSAEMRYKRKTKSDWLKTFDCDVT